MPGVRVRRTGGHTMHHQMVLIESLGRQAAFVGDVMPTRAHLRSTWIAAIDLFPMDTLAFKKSFVEEAVARQMLVFFSHDPAVAAGHIVADGRKLSVSAVQGPEV
jgi:glyoxylase-like metal-dependent hydrolase (beta-lactamase superfamily II)